MPTFSPIALDRLLEPGSRYTSPKPPPAPEKLENPVPIERPIPHRHVSPALYATPKTTPLPPDSPSSPSSFPPPSPYIVNHKRRGPRLVKNLMENSINCGTQSADPAPAPAVSEEKTEICKENGVEIKVNECNGDKFEEKKVERELEREREDGGEEGKANNGVNNGLEREMESDDFFDLNDSMSVASEDGNGIERLVKPSTPVGEFYDAFEEISSEGGATLGSNRNNNIEEELREIRLSLLMEIERRKQAEEALETLQNQWLRLSHHLSLLGFSLPPPPPPPQQITAERENNNEIDAVEELIRHIIVSKYVGEAIARGISRAEVEMEVDPIIQSKNFEISRLSDRVQYYEAANREMSHRNQEAIEMARQQRNRRKRRQKWFWASIGLTVTLSSAAIAWSYLPASKSVPTQPQDD